MEDAFRDKVAIVTGGASGLGQALCEELAGRGAKVIIADIDDPKAEQLATSINTHGGWARPVHMDVTKWEEVQDILSQTMANYSALDYMFNNAAQTATRGEMCDIPITHWHEAINVNFLGVIYGSVAAYQIMKGQGWGHIVNTGSIAGLVGFPTSIPYGATKAGVVNLSLALRSEGATRGIKVTVVCPGPIHGEERRHIHLIGIERAAQLILNGVARNRALIVFPLLAKVLWGLYRLSPAIVLPIGRRIMDDYHRHRQSEQ